MWRARPLGEDTPASGTAADVGTALGGQWRQLMNTNIDVARSADPAPKPLSLADAVEVGHSGDRLIVDATSAQAAASKPCRRNGTRSAAVVLDAGPTEEAAMPIIALDRVSKIYRMGDGDVHALKEETS